ncbi:MAG: homoserine O-acetyltransferase [Dehalococcoidia bacterium]|nr:homoserine O-acetyltransferase [Dehalococcoidia bacterium]
MTKVPPAVTGSPLPGLDGEAGTLLLGDYTLDGGATIRAEVAYERYGRLSPAGDNAIVVCHALTGSAHAAGENGWWAPLIGPGSTFDTDRYAVYCANIVGSCYGTTGPESVDPATGKPYAGTFPAVSVGDMVALQRLAFAELGVRSIVTAAGGSLGGMQVTEWAAQAPELVRSIIPIASVLAHEPWQIAFNEVARQAIRNDVSFHNGDYAAHGTSPDAGLALARMIAMISYRSAMSFDERFGRATQGGPPERPVFAVESYLRHQGERLVERFDANAYLRITDAMDRSDVGAGRGGAVAALAPFRGPGLVIAIDTDALYPPSGQVAIVEALRANGNRVEYTELAALDGHDAFLIEWGQLDAAIRPFLASIE